MGKGEGGKGEGGKGEAFHPGIGYASYLVFGKVTVTAHILVGGVVFFNSAPIMIHLGLYFSFGFPYTRKGVGRGWKYIVQHPDDQSTEGKNNKLSV